MLRRVMVAAMLMLPVSALAADKVFDPARDPAKDLIEAEKAATAEHKNILLDVGGNWCGWCMIFDRMSHSDELLHAAIEKGFVIVHVNVSKKNQNVEFLKQFPKVPGYPHFFVLDASGKLLKSQSTDYFETDHTERNGYNPAQLQRFFTHWTPVPQS